MEACARDDEIMKALQFHFILAALVSLLSSCAGPPFPPEPGATYAGNDGRLHCTLHNEALVVRQGYWTGEPIPLISPTDAYIKNAGRFPNHLGLAQSLTKTQLASKPCKVRYCESCERGLRTALD